VIQDALMLINLTVSLDNSATLCIINDVMFGRRVCQLSLEP